jgi:hypothetical protein
MIFKRRHGPFQISAIKSKTDYFLIAYICCYFIYRGTFILNIIIIIIIIKIMIIIKTH